MDYSYSSDLPTTEKASYSRRRSPSPVANGSASGARASYTRRRSLSPTRGDEVTSRSGGGGGGGVRDAYDKRDAEKKDDYDGRRDSKVDDPRPPRSTNSDPAPPPSRVVGVFGLSIRTRERDLEDEFTRAGKVDRVVIVYDQRSGRSRGFGFVTMADTEDARRAIKELNGVDLHGRRVRVDYSVTNRAHDPTPGQYMGFKRNHDFGPGGPGSGPGPRYSGGRGYDDWPPRRRGDDYHGRGGGGHGHSHSYSHGGGGGGGGYSRRSPSPPRRRRGDRGDRDRDLLPPPSRSRSRSPPPRRRPSPPLRPDYDPLPPPSAAAANGYPSDPDPRGRW